MSTNNHDPAQFDEKHDFKYVIGEKDDVIIVLLYGRIDHKAATAIESCEKELRDKSQKIIIFGFHDVAVFQPAAHSIFVQIQKDLRGVGKMLGHCTMRPDIKNSLLLSGIVRESEIFNNIPAAWKALSLKSQEQVKHAA